LSIAGLLLLLFLAPILFPGTVAEKIKKWTNESLAGELNFSKARLSFFNHFPSLTLTLYDFSLKGSAPFTKDTLVAADQVALGIDLSTLIFNKSIHIDKIFVSGALLNQPNWLRSIKQGDDVQVPHSAFTDWIYAINGRAYGGFTINAMRATMSRQERAEHDAAWGLDFGDPAKPELMPADWLPKPSGGFFKKLFGGAGDPAPDLASMEHPMAVNMVPSLHSKNDKGMTFLHQMALAGSKLGVELLVNKGADVNAVTNNGMTARQLAKTLGWKQVVDYLASKGAK